MDSRDRPRARPGGRDDYAHLLRAPAAMDTGTMITRISFVMNVRTTAVVHLIIAGQPEEDHRSEPPHLTNRPTHLLNPKLRRENQPQPDSYFGGNSSGRPRASEALDTTATKKLLKEVDPHLPSPHAQVLVNAVLGAGVHVRREDVFS